MESRSRSKRGPAFPCGAGLAALLTLRPGAAAAQEIQLTGPLAGEATYEPKEWDDVRMDGGAILPFVALVPSEPVNVVAGAGARISISVRTARPIWFEGDLFTAFLANDEHQILMVGGDVIGRWQLRPTLGLGLGMSAGYLSRTGGTFFESSPFFGPVLVPISTWLGGGHLEVRIACWVAEARLDNVSSLRPALIAPYVSLTFGGTVVPPMHRFDGGRSSY